MSFNGYAAYKQTSRTGLSLSQNVSLLLEKAAEHTARMGDAIREKDIERRVYESNKAALIISGLKEALISPDDKSAVTGNVLGRYYDTFQKLIFRASIRTDIKSAQAIEKSLREMAAFWREVDQNTSIAPLMPPKDIQAGSIQFGA